MPRKRGRLDPIAELALEADEGSSNQEEQETNVCLSATLPPHPQCLRCPFLSLQLVGIIVNPGSHPVALPPTHIAVIGDLKMSG